MSNDTFPTLTKNQSLNNIPPGIIDAAFVLRPDIIPEAIDKHELASYSYSPYITTAFYIEFARSPSIKLIIGKIPNYSEPVVIDNAGTIHAFKNSTERSEKGRYYKLLRLGRKEKRPTADHITIGKDDYLAEEELVLFYIPAQTDSEGNNVEECVTIFSSTEKQGNFTYCYLSGKKHEIISEILRLITLRNIQTPDFSSASEKIIEEEDEIDEERNKLTSDKQHLEKELNTLKSYMQDSIETVQEENLQLKTNNNLLQTQVSGLSDKVEVFQEQVNDKDTTIFEQQKIIEELKKGTSLKNTQLADLGGHISSTEQRLRKIVSKIDQTGKETQIEQSKYMEVMAIISLQKDTEVNKLLSEVEMKYSMIDQELNKTNSSLKNNIQKLLEQKKYLSDENEKNKELVIELSKRFDSIASKSAQDVKSIKEQVSKIQSEKQILDKELYETKKELKHLEEVNKNFSTQHQEIQLTKQLTTEQISHLKDENELLNRNLEKAENKNTQLKEYETELRTYIQKIETEKQSLNQEIIRLKDKLENEVRVQTSHLKDENELLNRNLEKAENKNTQLKEYETELRTYIQKTETEKQSLNQEIIRLRDKLENETKQTIDLKAKITNYKNEISNHMIVLAQKDKELLDVTEKIKDKKLEELQLTNDIKKLQEAMSLLKEQKLFIEQDSLVKTKELKESEKVKEELNKVQSELIRLQGEQNRSADIFELKEKEWLKREKEFENEKKRREEQETILQNQLILEHKEKTQTLRELAETRLQMKRQVETSNRTIKKLQEDIRKLMTVKDKIKQLEAQFAMMSKQSIGQMSSLLDDVSNTSQDEAADEIKEEDIKNDEVMEDDSNLYGIKMQLMRNIKRQASLS